MAKVIDSNVQSRLFSPLYSVWRIVIIGVGTGILYVALVTLIGKFTDSITASGNVATILAATVGLTALVVVRAPRPLVVVMASAIALWGLAGLTSGLGWLEIVVWDVLLYTIAYTLFSWLSRHSKIVPMSIVIITIIVLVRITITL